ncbi:MAG: hypothetical protein OEO20_00885 [Gemmatimonadota bacterium]|nr:hypothetical protein [Gemmatimonadota bacterium]MDH3368789.1 hypothetical protein [Gemmatimonadota bacterium]MDH3476844.1 hypothetical protein [Gemmatimonadota bacterium]MDH3571832.1 hypothetical protein [Gemmatimonadota bacterium]MDH5548468.1 hypothetical protein [Gemmatimonadota bacterium]
MAQTSACLTDPDTAALHAESVTQTVTVVDPTRLAGQGLPYRPVEGVSLVTNGRICRRVVDAYNALFPEGEENRFISRAYVLKVGKSAYAMVPEGRVDVYMYFDSKKYKFLAGMVAPE